MRTSRVGKVNRRGATGGFTLVELLIVVTLLSVLALGVGLSGGGAFSRSSPTPATLAAQFAESVQAARDDALFSRRATGLVPMPQGWQIVRRDPEGVWQPAARPVTAPGMVLTWEVGRRVWLPPSPPSLASGAPPAVRFRPDGGGDVFALTITGGQRTLRCRSNGWEAPACD